MLGISCELALEPRDFFREGIGGYLERIVLAEERTPDQFGQHK